MPDFHPCTSGRVRNNLSRFAGWLVTSPLAFFVGFVLELMAYWWGALKRRTRAS
jgi:hypothetical protein